MSLLGQPRGRRASTTTPSIAVAQPTTNDAVEAPVSGSDTNAVDGSTVVVSGARRGAVDATVVEAGCVVVDAFAVVGGLVERRLDSCLDTVVDGVTVDGIVVAPRFRMSGGVDDDVVVGGTVVVAAVVVGDGAAR